MEVNVKRVEPFLVAALRHVGPYPECAPVFGRLRKLLGAAKVCLPNAPAYGIFYDDAAATPAEKCRMDVCMPLPQGVKTQTPALAALLQTKEVFTQHLGNGGEYACVLVKGPYSLLPSAWRHLFEWLPQSGREPSISLCFEAYYNDPVRTAPQELLAEIFLPLKVTGAGI